VGVITEAENALKMLISPGRNEPIWTEEIVPVEQSTVPPPEVDDLQEAVAQALRQRPELKRLAGELDINQVQQEQNANLVKPQVNLVLGYGNTGLAGAARPGDNPFSASNVALYERVNRLSAQSGLTPLPAPSFGGLPESLVGGYATTLSNLFGGRFQTVQAGLAIDFTFRNQTAEANLAQSAIAERRLKLQQSHAEQAIQAQVRNAMQAIQTARQRIAAAEASVRAAAEKLESETRLFQNGESTNFLVLTRQNEYTDSRHRLLVARLDFNKAVARLEQAMGATLKNHGFAVR
jgi:HAE1 family hydrophobic/amphiphilic exporter-1